MKVKELLDLLEKIPVEREQLMEMGIDVVVPSATGQCTCHTGIKSVKMVEVGLTKHANDENSTKTIRRENMEPEYGLEFTTSFAT